MSMRGLVLMPLASTALAFALLLAFGLPELGIELAMEAAELMATVGSLAAALSFERGDYLRRAWLLSAASTALLLLRDLLVTTGLSELLPTPWLSLGVLVLACNVTTVLGSWYMAHIFQAAGLASQADSARFRLYTGLALLGAVAVTFPSFLFSFQAIRQGEPRAVVWSISAVGDVLSLSLVAPILLTAVAMRGGLLIYPWALLTTSIAAWLLYDVAGLLEHFALLAPESTHAVEELCSVLACAYTAAAGFAQRRIVCG